MTRPFRLPTAARCILVATLLLIWVSPIQASQLVDVTLKSGRRVTGHIVSGDFSSTDLLLRFRGEVTTLTRRIPRQQIVEIRPTQRPSTPPPSVADTLARFSVDSLAELADRMLFDTSD